MLIRNTNTSLKKKRKFFCTNIWESENVFPFLFIFVVFFPCSSVQYFFDAVRNQISSRKCLVELVKRASKVYQKNVSRERFLDFDQLKKNSENYMLIRDCNWIRTQNHLVLIFKWFKQWIKILTLARLLLFLCLVSFLFKKNGKLYILCQHGIKTDNRLKLFKLNCLQFHKKNNLWNICKMFNFDLKQYKNV